MSYSSNCVRHDFSQQPQGKELYHIDKSIGQLKDKIDVLRSQIEILKNGDKNFSGREADLSKRVIHYINRHCLCSENNTIGANLNQRRILTGNGAPDASSGENGDFYLDNDSGDYYFKIRGRWILRGNLRGPPGLPGTPGSRILSGNGAPDAAIGLNGDFYLDNINKNYYLKVGDSWIQQGTLNSNTPISFMVPTAFGTPVNVPSISGQSFQVTQGALVANGSNTLAPITNDNFVLPTETYYNFIYKANTNVVVHKLTVNFINTGTIFAGQNILVGFYFNSIGSQPDTYVLTVYNVVFQYTSDTLPSTSLTKSVQLGGSSGLQIAAGTSLVIGMIGFLGTDGSIPGNVSIQIS